MSVPVTRCLIVLAADNPAALQRLHEVMQINLKSGSMLCLPCSCDPKCRELTELETDRIVAQLGDLEHDQRRNTLSDLKRH